MHDLKQSMCRKMKFIWLLCRNGCNIDVDFTGGSLRMSRCMSGSAKQGPECIGRSFLTGIYFPGMGHRSLCTVHNHPCISSESISVLKGNVKRNKMVT